ncbi:MAG: Crp/Fnr family transcriptional regulator [Cyclobacteriaceae bacterium]
MIDVDLLKASGAKQCQFKTGEALFKEGDRCQYYHQIAQGAVRWVNTNHDGEEYLQYLAESGESIGEFPLFDEGVYAASAIAVVPTTVWRLPKSRFLHLLREHPDIHFAFSALLVKRLRFKFFLMKEIASHEPRQIVLSLINYLKRTSQHICMECGQILLTRRQIAEMTGMRVETVIRAMRQLNDQGLIAILDRKAYCEGSKGCVPGTCKTHG